MEPRVAIVTGASSGIGEATALKLAGLGVTVYAGARRVERMAALAEAGIHVVPLDVTDDASMAACVERVIAEAGRIDVLVNNAGYGSYGALEHVPMSEARRQVDVNVFGLARMTQLALPHMRSQRRGTVVNISSMGGKMYEPLGSWYHATKFAVEGLSDCLRLELAPFGIRVVVVEPGAITTEWGTIAANGLLETSGETAYADQAVRQARLLASDRFGSSPEGVAATIVKAALASRPRTRYVVGAGARPLLAARRVLPDKAFDALLMLVFRSAR